MASKIIIPTSLSEITLKQYQELMKLQDENDSNIVAAQKMISILCRVRFEEVLQFEAVSVYEIVGKLNNIFKEKTEFVQTFKIGEYEFGFIPDLESMTFGEYIDSEKYMQEWDTMHKAMAVFYRQITKRKGEQYEIEPYVSAVTYADMMELMPLNVVLGATFFFRVLSEELLIATMDYLEQQTKEMLKTTHQPANLQIDGDGIKAFIHSAKVMLDEWTALPHYRSINA
jgi:hypothetical protein